MNNYDHVRFENLLKDLCTAFDKPFTDDRVRVFWDVLKGAPYEYVATAIKNRIHEGGKFPQPFELKPRSVAEAANNYRPPKPEHTEPIHAHAQKCLFAYLQKHGAVSEASLKLILLAKTKITAQFREIYTEDKTVTGAEIRDRLFSAWDKVFMPMPPDEPERHTANFRRTGFAADWLQS